MKGIKPFVKAIPFIMLGACFIFSFLVHMPIYAKIYRYLANIVGFSIFTNCFFLYFIVRNNMCAYSFVATIGLVCLNLLNIINIYHPIENFYKYYLSGVSGFFFLLTSIFFLTQLTDGKRNTTG